MILDGIVTVLVSALTAVIGLMPPADALPTLPIGPAIGLMRTVDTILPVHEVLPVIVGCIALMGGVFLFRLTLTVWHAIPGKFS